MDTSDPMQMGRCKIWCPSLDGERYTLDNLPWAEYATPMAGVTNNFPRGRELMAGHGSVSYGFWSPPKLNSIVYVFLLNGDSNRRVFFAGKFDLHRNRSLPFARNKSPEGETGPFTDTYDRLEPAATNLREQFNNQIDSEIARARGAYERQVAQDRTEKDGTEGYAPDVMSEMENRPSDKFLDPQTYCWTTPGGHAIIMSDIADHCRVRVKTTEGAQVIIDDTNERIYVSTAKGKTWLELDEDGHIHVYGSRAVSVTAGTDINFSAGGNFNVQANGAINLKAGGKFAASSGGSMDLNSGGHLAATSCSTLDLIGNGGVNVQGSTLNLTGDGGVLVSGSTINLNGPAAKTPQCATLAGSPSLVPSHEPWVRPEGQNRNSRWKG